MTAPTDCRRLLWGLLGFWVFLEFLVASRWWPPAARPPLAAPASADTSLRALLEREAAGRVWFAPYTTFPETGVVESRNRGGVYDTFLAIPVDRGLAANYGAPKLTPADTLFSLASGLGLAAELRLARQLGDNLFALDVGAVSDPEAATELCRRTAGCRLSGDGYALFRLDGPAAGDGRELTAGLGRLQRRIPELPSRSGGPSWGPLVFHRLQWDPPEWQASSQALPRFRVKARLLGELEIYRYPLDRFPAAVRPWLDLGPEDVRLRLGRDLKEAQVCLLPPGASRCEVLVLGPGQPQVAIGDRLRPGGITRIRLGTLIARAPGAPVASPLTVEIQAPAAAAALMVDR